MTRSLLAAVLAGLLLAACGGGGASDENASDESASSRSGSAGGAVFGTGSPVTIDGYDLYFEPKELKVPAGTLDVTYVNKGGIYHTLEVDGVKGFKLEVTRKGDRDQGSVDLTPGQHIFYCDVPGHRVAGMETRVTVE